MAAKDFKTRYFEALQEMENPTKDAKADVGKFSYDYATLDMVFDVVKPILSKHGLFLRQGCYKDGDGWILRTYIFDATEEMMVDERPLIFGSDSQRNGIVETYARRYAVNCCMGLAPVDSDAKETRGAVQTTDALKNRIEKGIASLSDIGVDATSIVNDFAGWEVDMQIATNLLNVLTETYRTSKAIQDKYPNTEIKENK